MKKLYIFLVFALIFSTSMLIAEESVLIDFNELIDDAQGENEATIIDFSSVAGTRFTDEEKATMVKSLYIPNWEVNLASSSRSIINDNLSYVKAVTVGENSAQFPGEQIMGMRIHFPEGNFNSYAYVNPPFLIPAYATADIDNAPVGEQFSNKGVVKNVGVLKSVKANMLGMNFPYGFAIVLRDEDDNRKTIFMGYLDFDGWRELVWNNPNYITEVRNREIRKYPLYPNSSPSMTLDSFLVFKDAAQTGGDFVSYIKDVNLVYDLAVYEDVDTDLDHEAVWGILSEREEERRNAELQNLGNKQVERYLETQKMHKDEEGEEAAAAE